MKRSKISASARTEQAISGQMGQPAACMMDSNSLSARVKASADYGPACGWPPVTKGYEKATTPKALRTHPQNLWITLWASWASWPRKVAPIRGLEQIDEKLISEKSL
jgi:hypothetical protein